MANTIKFSQLTEDTPSQMQGTDFAVGYTPNGANKKWTLENQADFLLNDSDAGQAFQESFVKVQDTEPSDENTRVWIEETPQNEVTVPTYGEFEELKVAFDFVSSNVVASGYTAYDNLYISTSALKIYESPPSQHIKLLVFAVDPNKKYIVKKSTATIMRVAVGSVAEPEAITVVSGAVGHASASANPLYINTGSTDTYMYLQLYANADSSDLKSVEASIGSLTICADRYAEIEDEIAAIEDETNDIAEEVDVINGILPNCVDDGYTIMGDASGFYYLSKSSDSAGKAFGRMYYTADANKAKRTIRLSVEPNRRYKIEKKTSTIMKVTVAPMSAPGSNDWLNDFAEHLSASSDPLYVTTGNNDIYMFVMLFTDNDETDLKSIDANIETLRVTALPTLYAESKLEAEEKRRLLAPYTFGAVNQIARLGWRTTDQRTPPIQSIPSYALALRNGVKIMLADVRITADGEYVCWHDAGLSLSYIRHPDGTTLSDAEKALKIEDLTLAELDEFDFGIYRGSQYAGTKMLRLTDFLDWCALTNCIPFMETKVEFTEAQIIEFAGLIRKAKLENQIIIGVGASSPNISYWIENLPRARFAVMSGATNFSGALGNATALKAGGIEDVYIGFATPSSITDEIIDAINAVDVHLWYTEITSVGGFNDFYDAGYFKYYTLVSSSWLNISEMLFDKLY